VNNAIGTKLQKVAQEQVIWVKRNSQNASVKDVDHASVVHVQPDSNARILNIYAAYVRAGLASSPRVLVAMPSLNTRPTRESESLRATGTDHASTDIKKDHFLIRTTVFSA